MIAKRIPGTMVAMAQHLTLAMSSLQKFAEEDWQENVPYIEISPGVR
jgi:hypothetical protein